MGPLSGFRLHTGSRRARSLGSYAVARATCGSTAWRCRFKGVCSVEAHAEKLPEERLKGKAFSGVSVLARMAFAVRLAQVGNGEFGVVLEGVEGLVSEQFLDVVGPAQK